MTAEPEQSPLTLPPLLTRTPERVAFAGDWHANTQWACGRVMSAAAHGVTVLIQLGDFGVWPGAGGQRYLNSLQKVAARSNVHVLFLDGNHEDFTQLDALERIGGLGYVRDNIWHIPRGTRWEWGGLRCGALGGATSVDRAQRTEGVDWWPEEALSADDVNRFAAGGPVDVAITHDRPAGVATPGITRAGGVALWGEESIDRAEAHERLLADALIPTKPRLVLHGHLHTRYTTTWHYPGGTAQVEGLDCEKRPGNTIVLTTDELEEICADGTREP